MHSKFGKISLVLVFLVALWLPLIAMTTGPREITSTGEKRRLAEMPQLNLSQPQKFTKEFESFYDDHFGLRQLFIRWFHLIQVTLLNVSSSGSVIKGRDGWLFQTGELHEKDIRNAWPFSDGELKRWAKVLQNKYDTLKSMGIDYLFVIPPNKHLVYGEHLPSSIKKVGKYSRAEQLEYYIRKNTTVPILFLRPNLLESKDDIRLYHKTDTHWNDYGAYVGYANIIKLLQEQFSNLPLIKLDVDDFITIKKPGGDLAENLNLGDVFIEQHITPKHWRPKCAQYSGIPQNATRFEKFKNPFTTRCKSAQQRLLMFRDSYSLDMMPYLSETFRYIHYFPASPVPLEGMLKLVKEHRPDIVIEERASRWLRTPAG